MKRDVVAYLVCSRYVSFRVVKYPWVFPLKQRRGYVVGCSLVGTLPVGCLGQEVQVACADETEVCSAGPILSWPGLPCS